MKTAAKTLAAIVLHVVLFAVLAGAQLVALAPPGPSEPPGAPPVNPPAALTRVIAAEPTVDPIVLPIERSLLPGLTAAFVAGAWIARRGVVLGPLIVVLGLPLAWSYTGALFHSTIMAPESLSELVRTLTAGAVLGALAGWLGEWARRRLPTLLR